MLDLSTHRLALRHNRLTSLGAFRRATPDALAALREHRAPITRLIEAGDPDVLDALFGDVDWQACTFSFPNSARGLTLVWTHPADEPIMWAALRAALRARRTTAGREGR